jgi:hypothetical protein
MVAGTGGGVCGTSSSAVSQHIKKLSPLNGPFLKMSLSHENTRNIWRMPILYRIQSFTFLLFNKFILQYLFLDFSYIVEVSFIGGGNWRTRRKPLICRKSLTNLIT